MNLPNSNGWHSLIFAVYGGHIEIVDYLIYETDVNLDQKDIKNGRTAMQIAECRNDTEMVELFAEHHQR